MKKVIALVLVVGLFGWAVYDFVIQPDDSSSVEETTGLSEGSQTEKVEDVNKEEGTVGLERGNIAPDFEVKTLEGETVNLSDFRGNKVMLNFWATWCPPCRAEMPDMQRFYEDTDVVILAVNLTETKNERDNVDSFVDEYGLTFPILLDENLDVSTLYRIQPIPTSYLINSDGSIHNMAFGALNYELMLQEFEKMK